MEGRNQGRDLKRSISKGSRYAVQSGFSIERKVSNVLDTKDAALKRREQLEIAQRFVSKATANGCTRWYEERSTAWTYRATEMWGSGTQQQIKVLLSVFLLFWIMCHSGRPAEAHASGRPAEAHASVEYSMDLIDSGGAKGQTIQI